MNALKDVVSQAIATPASINVARGKPSELRAVKYAIETAPIAPTNAANGNILIPWKNVGTLVASTIVAPSPAPSAAPIK